MKNRNIVFTVNLLAVACLGIGPLAQARQQSEDRGNGNSAAENVQALNLGTTGSNNTAHGWFSLFSNTTGSSNTADGFQTLLSNTTGTNNTATGFGALFSNTTGNTNTAMGFEALFSNTTAGDNTATGFGALFSNTTGIENTAIGSVALNRNTTGTNNTATGFGALFSNTIGTENTASGSQALNQNTEGNANTAVGRSALFSNTIGDRNTAIGFRALVNNTTGSFNTAIGDGALTNSTGRDNTALGEGAGSAITTGSGNVHIGTFVTGFSGDETNTTRVRNIGLTPIVGGLPVVMEAFGPSGDGKLGIGSSSRRYKEDIKPMDKASERLFALKPVTFRAKANMDLGHVKHYGFIAEDVAAVDSDLVVYNAEGQPETLRFDSINAMLLNEFLKEHRKVREQGRKAQEQEAMIAQLKSAVAQQQKKFQLAIAQQQKTMESVIARLKEQDSKIERVGDQIQLVRPAPQVASLAAVAPRLESEGGNSR